VDSLLFFSFLFPTELISGIAGPEETKNHSGGNVHRLIQIRLLWCLLRKSSPPCQDNSPPSANRRFQLHKCSQLFIRMHNETLSVAAMRVCDEDCSPVGINAETQPQLQPALLRLSAMISQYFTRRIMFSLFPHNDKNNMNGRSLPRKSKTPLGNTWQIGC
jgi:hypothetical protein